MNERVTHAVSLLSQCSLTSQVKNGDSLTCLLRIGSDSRGARESDRAQTEQEYRPFGGSLLFTHSQRSFVTVGFGSGGSVDTLFFFPA